MTELSKVGEYKKSIVYQTRSDDKSGVQEFETFDDAYEAYIKDSTIWQIKLGEQIWVKKHNFEEWTVLSEKKLCQLSKAYTEKTSEVYWIQQSEFPRNYETIWANKMDIVQKDFNLLEVYHAECIHEVLSNEEFRTRFSKKF